MNNHLWVYGTGAVGVLVAVLALRLLSISSFNRRLGGTEQRRAFGAALRSGVIPPEADIPRWYSTLLWTRRGQGWLPWVFAIVGVLATLILIDDLLGGGAETHTYVTDAAGILAGFVGGAATAVSGRRSARLLAAVQARN